jgi:predicted protein tyrosine phosphatase
MLSLSGQDEAGAVGAASEKGPWGRCVMTETPKRGPLPDSYWLLDGRFLAGQYPGAPDRARARRKVASIVETGVRTFIDLTHVSDGLDPYADLVEEIAVERKLELRHRPFSVLDLGIPPKARMVEILATIRGELDEGRPVYVHCWGGIGRTGTVVGCWLVEDGLTPAQALERIAALRTGLPSACTRSPETDEQCDFVHAWSTRNEAR